MSNKLQKLGKNTLKQIEIGNVSIHGIWLLVYDHEYFMSFKEFPWFAKATIEQINDVVLLSPTHLYWQNLDIDLHLDSIKNPIAFPLKYA